MTAVDPSSVNVPLCWCGHREDRHVHAKFWKAIPCLDCTCLGWDAPAPVPVSDEAEAPKRLLTTDEERDRLFEASGHTSSGEGWSALIDVVENLLAARLAGKDDENG